MSDRSGPTLEEYLDQKQQEIEALSVTEPTAKQVRRQKLIEALENSDLRPAEVAARLGVHVNTVKRMLTRGEFKDAYRVGSRGDWRVPRESVEAFKKSGGANV